MPKLRYVRNESPLRQHRQQESSHPVVSLMDALRTSRNARKTAVNLCSEAREIRMKALVTQSEARIARTLRRLKREEID